MTDNNAKDGSKSQGNLEKMNDSDASKNKNASNSQPEEDEGTLGKMNGEVEND